MKTHYLKTINPSFKDIKIGVKTFELRKDDRSFEAVDTLILQEYIPHSNTYTGDEVHKVITHVCRDITEFGLALNHCILSLKTP